jgi:hypothetical protein
VIIIPPRSQHTVSRVVLRRFMSKNRVSVFDRELQSIYPSSPKSIFKLERFDAHDPLGSEARWQKVETQMQRVYRAIDERKILDDPRLLDVLYDLLAVHWVRSPALKMASEQVRDGVIAASHTRLADRHELLGISFKQRTGLHPTGPEALAEENRRLHTLKPGVPEQWFSESLSRNFGRAQAEFRRSQIQIGYAPAGGQDFMIGDAPVIIRKPGHDGFGPHQGVALGDVEEICMPIGPDVLVALGPEPGAIDLTESDVDRFNEFQIRSFVRWLGAHPGGRSDQQIRANIKVRAVVPVE